MNPGYTAAAVTYARTFLFVPGNRPERFSKAVAAQPDIVVIDLEDAVSAADKDTAREHVEEWLSTGNAGMVRINAVDTDWHEADLALVGKHGVPVMVPKAERADTIRHLALLTPAPVIVPLVESAAGITAAADICAAPGVQRLAFGSIDLAAELGIDPDDRDALLLSRSTLVLAAAAASLAGPIDGVTTALTDMGLLVDDFAYARRLGMTAKLCIHPAQVVAVHAAAAPSADELQWAQRIIAACGDDGSALAVDGQMVDAPVLARARRIAAAAHRS
jgi:citrate lyase subunit beta / citryl-CoA lyase